MLTYFQLKHLHELIIFTDHILATAAGNGAVVLWNLNKITKQKQGALKHNVLLMGR